MIVILNCILQLYFLFIFNKHSFQKRELENILSNSCMILSVLILAILLFNHQNNQIYFFVFILYFCFSFILFSSTWYKLLMETIIFCILSFCSSAVSTLITYFFSA